MTDETRIREAVELWQAGEPLYLTDEQEKLALEAKKCTRKPLAWKAKSLSIWKSQ